MGYLGPGVHKVWFEPSEHLWWIWGLIINKNFPLALSCWGFSFALGCGVSFSSRIQHSPVDGCSVVSCKFGVLTGEDELTSFYTAILAPWLPMVYPYNPFFKAGSESLFSILILIHFPFLVCLDKSFSILLMLIFKETNFVFIGFSSVIFVFYFIFLSVIMLFFSSSCFHFSLLFISSFLHCLKVEGLVINLRYFFFFSTNIYKIKFSVVASHKF